MGVTLRSSGASPPGLVLEGAKGTKDGILGQNCYRPDMKKKASNFAMLYDGTHFAVNRKKWAQRGFGSLLFSGFHEFLQRPLKGHGKLAYAGWHQGIRDGYQIFSTEDELQGMEHAQLLSEVESCQVAVHWKSLKQSISSWGIPYWKERQIDVALTVDAMRLFYDKKIRMFLLMTSDMDYVPLVDFLVEKKCTVIVAGFNFGYGPLHRNLAEAATNTWHLEYMLQAETNNPALFQKEPVKAKVDGV